MFLSYCILKGDCLCAFGERRGEAKAWRLLLVRHVNAAREGDTIAAFFYLFLIKDMT